MLYPTKSSTILNTRAYLCLSGELSSPLLPGCFSGELSSPLLSDDFPGELSSPLLSRSFSSELGSPPLSRGSSGELSSPLLLRSPQVNSVHLCLFTIHYFRLLNNVDNFIANVDTIFVDMDTILRYNINIENTLPVITSK